MNTMAQATLNRHSRRVLLRACGLLAILPALQACKTGSGTVITPAYIITQAQNGATALLAMVNNLAAQYPALIPPDTLAKIQSDITLAIAAAGSLATNMPAVDAATILATVVQYINAVLNTLAMPPINGLIPAPFNMVVSAIAFALPVLEAFIAQYLPATPPAASSNALAFRAKALSMHPMTADASARILSDWAAKK